jgi:uncharacterized protein with FMN-binding domain
MRPRAIAGGVFASASVLLIGWQIGASQVTATSSSGAPATSGTSGSSSSTSSGSGSSSTSTPSSTPSASTPSSTSGSSSSKAATVSGTFDGTTAQTQYGPVQVEIVVSAGTITDVKALQLTDQGGRSVEISNEAAPILRTEALSAQSADIQSVSGATYTSQGYVTSLQAALDTAGL